MTERKAFIILFLILLTAFIAVGCSEADTVSSNISRAADTFEVERRIVFYNGITDKYILVIEGYCSLGNHDPLGELSVTCKVGEEQYRKHFLGRSDNVTYFVEQLAPKRADGFHYRVLFRPETVLPDIDLQLSK